MLGTLFDIVTCLPRGKPHYGHPRDDEYGDISVKKHMTSSLNLEATSMANLISWKYEECFEPIFYVRRARMRLKGSDPNHWRPRISRYTLRVRKERYDWSGLPGSLWTRKERRLCQGQDHPSGGNAGVPFQEGHVKSM